MKNKEEILTKAVSIYAKQHDLSLDAAVSKLNKMSEDEINNIFDNMKLFKDGGKLDYLLCLKKGGSIKDCGCGGDIKKADQGNKLTLDVAPSNWLAKLLTFKPTVHPREDGMKGGFSGVIDGKDTTYTVTGPYTKFEMINSPEKTVYKRYDNDGPYTYKNIPEDVVKMFENIKSRFKK